MRTFVYFIGEPGAGKTSLVQALTASQVPHPMRSPVPHIVYNDGSVAQIGRMRGDFGGTDALGMAIQPRVEDWLQQRPYRTIFAEGDRLANGKFFRAVQDAGYELRVVCLTPSPAVAAQRRRARAFTMGVPEQNTSWLQGRMTKVRRLAVEFDARSIVTDWPLPRVVELVRGGGLDPFAEAAKR